MNNTTNSNKDIINVCALYRLVKETSDNDWTRKSKALMYVFCNKKDEEFAKRLLKSMFGVEQYHIRVAYECNKDELHQIERGGCVFVHVEYYTEIENKYGDWGKFYDGECTYRIPCTEQIFKNQLLLKTNTAISK